MTRLAQGLIVLTVALLGWLLPALFFDDAYITFRYAANLAAGEGFSYNPPELLLGVTTPLFTLLLAAAARLGSDLETAALVLGVAGHGLLCLALFATVRLLLARAGGPSERAALAVAALAGLTAALHPHLALTAMGGMETSLYCALILMTLNAASASRGAATGVWLGLALLTRPDAVLVALPAAWLLWGGDGPRAQLARAATAASVIFLPWAALATWWFGSPVPHSIAAKRQIHPYGPMEVLAEFGRFLRDDPALLLLLPAALIGWWALRRVPLAAGLGLFALLYLAAYAFSGITPFPWYVNPLIGPVIALAAAGVVSAARRAAALRAGAPLVFLIALALLAFMGAQLRAQAPQLQQAWEEWEGVYEIAGRWILNDSKPGDTVYVGEVGVIGYLLPGRVILDSSGINSREVHALRRGLAEEDPEWSRQVIRTLAPDYITTASEYLHIETLSREPWFMAAYEQASIPLLEEAGQVIFRKRRP